MPSGTKNTLATTLLNVIMKIITFIPDFAFMKFSCRKYNVRQLW